MSLQNCSVVALKQIIRKHKTKGVKLPKWSKLKKAELIVFIQTHFEQNIVVKEEEGEEEEPEMEDGEVPEATSSSSSS